MTITNLGRIRPVPKGVWASNTSYKELDIVSHNGSSYIRTISGVGTTVPSLDLAHWELLAEKGLKGDTGTTYRIKTFNWIGKLNSKPGKVKWYPEANVIITSLHCQVSNVSTSPISVKVNSNGIFLASITLEPNNFTSYLGDLSFAVSTSDYLTVDVDAISGSDLSLVLNYQ